MASQHEKLQNSQEQAVSASRPLFLHHGAHVPQRSRVVPSRNYTGNGSGDIFTMPWSKVTKELVFPVVGAAQLKRDQTCRLKAALVTVGAFPLRSLTLSISSKYPGARSTTFFQVILGIAEVGH